MSDTSAPTDDVRERAFAIVRRHGRASTSFQTLERGFLYWFDGGDAFVPYKDTGRAWVAAGEPVAPPERVAEVAAGFVREAHRRGRRACFFAVGAGLTEDAAFARTPIGEEPIWDPAEWEETLRSSRKLREQVRRARAKGVRTRVLAADEVLEGAPLRGRLEALSAHWLETRRMAPMAFLGQVDPFARPDERTFVLAERDGEPVALLVAVPVYERGGWLVEHVFREPVAPNGTAETLVDRLMREVAGRGSRWVSLGLAPLSGAVPPALRIARRLGRRFYNFEGLYAFKARLRPRRWETRYLARPHGRGAAGAVLDALVAFTPRGLLPFAAETIRHLGRPLVHALCLLLVPWTLLLALSSRRWFPAPSVKWAWVVFDVVLVVLMLAVVRRWRSDLVRLLALLTGTDAVLTAAQAMLYNVPRIASALDALVVAAGVTAPTLAAALFGLLAGEGPPPGSSDGTGAARRGGCLGPAPRRPSARARGAAATRVAVARADGVSAHPDQDALPLRGRRRRRAAGGPGPA